MKKTMIVLVSVALVLILIVGILLVEFFFKLTPKREETQPFEDYLAEHWTVFRLKRWDAGTGNLELEYPLRFTYEQMKKYGASMDELRELPTGNLDTVASLKAAALNASGVELRAVTVFGVTTDGQIAYTVFPDGTIQACWDE